MVLCLFFPPLLLILLLLPSKNQLVILGTGSTVFENDGNVGRVTIETHQRGLFGRLVALAFWGWHATMVVLLIALIAGLIIGMLQAATQINESTLSFIPKLLLLVLTLFVAGPWILRVLTDFTYNLYTSIPAVIG